MNNWLLLSLSSLLIGYLAGFSGSEHLLLAAAVPSLLLMIRAIYASFDAPCPEKG
ncbi:hypothetical protein [Ferviditalea candida]|uniref:Uncharacterized protein n=1 Tax=Ferviditalea candida TaxID=3108399 RepID=A0ABU5ZFN5_9BACL|nr:hypothetical protein [Paenibacillaceae bacterium T2]